MVGGALTVDDIDAIAGMSSGGVDHGCRDGRSTSSRILLGEASEPASKLREGIDRAAARDRRVATDWFLAFWTMRSPRATPRRPKSGK